jgi:hypothetical protein
MIATRIWSLQQRIDGSETSASPGIGSLASLMLGILSRSEHGTPIERVYIARDYQPLEEFSRPFEETRG